MVSVKVFLFTHKTLKDGSHPVVLQVIKDCKRKLVSLGYSAKPTQWNELSNTPNSKHPKSDELKKIIKKKKMAVEKRIMELDEALEPFGIDDIVEVILGDKKASSFDGYTKHLVKVMKKEGRNGNARLYEDVSKAFIAFVDEDDIDFKKITPKRLAEYESSMKARGVKTNSISVYMRTIRAIYNKAIMDDVVSEKYYPFKYFKIRNEKTVKRAIPKEKLTEIKNLDLSGEKHLKLARDIFLFSFYMRGMNFIDIFYMKVEDIKDDRISYRRRKTKQLFSVKVSEPAMNIIKAYSKRKKPESYVFPVINKKNEYDSYRTAIRNLNKYLKKVGERVKLDIPLSSYVARHSWATIAKFSGIPTAVISEGLGHNSEKTTQIYLDSFDNEIIDDANEIIIDI